MRSLGANMSGVRKARPLAFATYLCIVLAALSGTQLAYGQGCIVARSSSTLSGPETEGGYLAPGEFNLTTGYRHQYSFRHFVGDVEQKYRMQQGTQVMNKINLLNFDLTYQINRRYSVTVDMPLLMASRRGNSSPYTTSVQGIGDTFVSAQGWIFDTRENNRGNVQVGLGVLFPTGRDNAMNRIDAFDGKGPRDVLLDYSIQPGSGGYGLLFQWQSFKNLGNSTQLYMNGDYIATPQNTNGVRRSATANPLLQYVSLSDQYLLEAGVAHVVSRVRGLTLTFGPRWEGVPAKDLIGDSTGFRRPGYAISLVPGAQYSFGKHILTAQVGKAIHRDRTRSLPDRLIGAHGDAAFADYLWLVSYSFRFGAHHHASLDRGHDNDTPSSCESIPKPNHS